MKATDFPIKSLEIDLRGKLHNNGNRGHLYFAIETVAKHKNVLMNNFINSCRITQKNTLDEDEDILVYLGFPEHYLQQKKSIHNDIYYLSQGLKQPQDHISYLLITAATSIVLLHQEEVPNLSVTSNRSSSGAADKRSTTSKELNNEPPPIPRVAQPIIRRLSLAMVLQGKDIEGIEPQNILALGQIEALLFSASYFLCTSQQNMRQIEPLLSRTEIKDRKSEPQVLLVLQFNSPLGEGKTFKNRLELMEVLRAVTEYNVSDLATLTKVSGLTNLGFISS